MGAGQIIAWVVGLAIVGWLVNFVVYRWMTRDSIHEDIANPVEILLLIPWSIVPIMVVALFVSVVEHYRDQP